MNKKESSKRYVSPEAAYATYALADEGKIEPVTKTTTPTERGVIEAKEFVDDNKK